MAPDRGKLRCSQERGGQDALGYHHLPPRVAGLFLIIFCFPDRFFGPSSSFCFPASPVGRDPQQLGVLGPSSPCLGGTGGRDGVRRGHEPGAGGMQLGSAGTTAEDEAEPCSSSSSDGAVCAVAERLWHGGVQQPCAGSLVKWGDRAMGVTSPKAAERRQLPPARSCNRRPRRRLRAAGSVSLRED